jgi:teichuronic acid biosynthesis glycosyltransferase TuaH
MTGYPPVHYVPFHDARKWEREGLRTRDGHVYRQLVALRGDERMRVLDRPTCLAEVVRLKGRWRSGGSPLLSRLGASVARGPAGGLVGDVLLPQLGFRDGSFHLWQLHAYGDARYVREMRALLDARDGDEAGILWLCHPFAVRLLDTWPRRRVVVDAFDNFAIHPELPPRVREAAAAAYRRLAAEADAIVVNSVRSQEFFREQFGRETTFVPNGVSVELFRDAAPMAMSDVARPIVGYAGKLGQRIDVELVRRLADVLVEGTLVLAGQVLNRDWMRAALAHPRIRWVGDLHYSRLPGFLAACDVCIVPHRVGAGENHGDATKLYEYLAAGKPVVTTAIGGVDRFRDRVIVAGDADTFVAATLALARGGRPPEGGVLPDETWRARTLAVCQALGVEVPPTAGTT